MAEGIIVHFKDATERDVRAQLGACANLSTETWAAPKDAPYCILIYCLANLETDYDEAERQAIEDRLGSVPSFSLIMEFRRSEQNKACDLTKQLLTDGLCRLSYLVDDSDGGLWTNSDVMERLDEFLSMYYGPSKT